MDITNRYRIYRKTARLNMLPLKTKVIVDGNKKGTIIGIFSDYYGVQFTDTPEGEPPVKIVHTSTVKEDPNSPKDQLFVVEINSSFVININNYTNSKDKKEEILKCIKNAIIEMAINNMHKVSAVAINSKSQFPGDWTGDEVPYSIDESENRTINEIFNK